jgi:PAS domain-containing protein
MMLITDLVTTPDGGLTATFAGFLAMALSAITMAGWKWINKRKEEEQKVNEKAKVESLSQLAADVAALKSELKTNGGSSIKDIVNATHKEVTHLKEQTYSLQEQMDNVVAANRARTELALDQSIIAQFMANDKGEVDYVNDAMSDLFGLGKNHFLRNKWLSIIDSQGVREEIVRRLTFAIDRKISFSLSDIPCRHGKNERTFKVKLTIDPKVDSKDRFLWYIGKIKVMEQKEEETKPITESKIKS